MKLYLDENLSPRFRHLFDSQHLSVLTYQFMNWQGKKNGELLKLMVDNGFKGVITSDKLMYSDEQLKQFNLHFFLIQSALDTVVAREPLFKELNTFIIDNYTQFGNTRCSKTIVTDGIVNKSLAAGPHLLWIE